MGPAASQSPQPISRLLRFIKILPLQRAGSARGCQPRGASLGLACRSQNWHPSRCAPPTGHKFTISEMRQSDPGSRSGSLRFGHAAKPYFDAGRAASATSKQAVRTHAFCLQRSDLLSHVLLPGYGLRRRLPAVRRAAAV